MSDFEREKLSRRYDHIIIDLSKKYIKDKKYDSAEKVLLNSFHRNPFAEEISELLLKLYIEAGQEKQRNTAFQHLRGPDKGGARNSAG